MVVPKSRGVGGGGSRAFVLLRCLKASPFLAILLYIIVIYSMNDGSDSLFDEGGGSGRSHQTHTSLQKQPHQPKSQRQQWQSKNSAVLAMATNMDIDGYQRFVGSLRATGFSGTIILGISDNASDEIRTYLSSQQVIMKDYVVDKCTYSGQVGNEGKPIDMESPPSAHPWKCPKSYPDYKQTHARFVLYKDWIMNDCAQCTDGIMLTDARDAFYQADPFVMANMLGTTHPIMVFEEIKTCPEHPPFTEKGCDEILDNTHWLTDFPVKNCRNYTVGKTPMLCSGSTMGTREGILSYLTAMRAEMDYWKTKEECRIDIIGDDQSIHNYLYYSGQLPGAAAIPHRTGPIHVAGWHAARITEVTKKEAEAKGVSDITDYYVSDSVNAWQKWLPVEWGLIDPKTGLITNLDGRPSAQIHQYDRYNELITGWQSKMKEMGWPYNKYYLEGGTK